MTTRMVSMAYSLSKGPDLRYIIPEIFELQPEHSKIFVVSAWISINIGLVNPWDLKEITFIDLINSKREIGIETEFYLSSMSKDEHYTQESIALMEKYHIKHTVVQQLHSKAIIGQYLFYSGSANITYNGLNSNKETVGLYSTEDPLSELRKILGDINGT